MSLSSGALRKAIVVLVSIAIYSTIAPRIQAQILNAPAPDQVPAPPHPANAMTPATKPLPALPEGTLEKVGPFVLGLWPDANKRGVSKTLFDRAFTGFQPDAEIFDLLSNQPEHVAAPWDYMNRLVSENRIETGKAKLAQQAGLLANIEVRLGVDKNVVLAIWGVESNFGLAPGNRHVIRSLTTLAIGDQRRLQFWRNELLTALLILEKGDVTLDHMTGSWAGAMGHTQFMPSSYVAHAIDFDGDGRRDIWDSVPDALASTANYLKIAGWQRGEAWGHEVVLPAGFDFSFVRPGISKSAGAWQALGLSMPFGRPFPVQASELSLILPAGAFGPAFLVSGNFRAILKYNNAVLYALAVGHLADRIGGGDAVAGTWPTNDPPLNRVAREDLQRMLAGLGYEIGAIDGMIGAATRTAIRAYQVKNGLPEDGWAGERILHHLKTEGGRRK